MMRQCSTVEQLRDAWMSGSTETIFVDPGEYVLYEPLSRILSESITHLPPVVGSGSDTHIISPSGCAAFSVRQAVPYRYARGGGWHRMRFTGRALQIEACERFSLADLEIHHAAGHAIEIVGDGNDSNQSRLWTMERCDISRSEGRGLMMSYGRASNAAFYRISECSFSRCAGGIEARSMHGTIERCAFDRCHSSPDIAIGQGGSHNLGVQIADNWFESSGDCAVAIDGLYSGIVERNSVAMGSASTAGCGFRVGHTELPGEVRCRFADNRWVCVSGSEFTAYDLGHRVNIISIDRDHWHVPQDAQWDGDVLTKYRMPDPLQWRQVRITDQRGDDVQV
jgi:hypothetical protein